jgi:hypothetical protein
LSDDFESVRAFAEVWKTHFAKRSFDPLGFGTFQAITKTSVMLVNKSQSRKSYAEGSVFVASSCRNCDFSVFVAELDVDDDDWRRQSPGLVEGWLIVRQPVASPNPDGTVVIQKERVAVRVVPNETLGPRYAMEFLSPYHTDSCVGAYPDPARTIVSKKYNLIADQAVFFEVVFQLEAFSRQLQARDTKASTIT